MKSQHFNYVRVSGIVVSDALANYLEMIKDQLYDTHAAFRIFPGEALVAAALEYAKYHRNDTPEKRLAYIWEKAYLYQYGKDFTGTFLYVNDELIVEGIPETDDGYLPF